MKHKIVLVIIVIMGIIGTNSAIAADRGVPTYLWVSTYAINDYPGTEKDPPRSIAHADRMWSELAEWAGDYYPSINTMRYIKREESSATRNNFLNDRNDMTEFVFFAGHGDRGSIKLYDQSVWASTMRLSNWNRWAIFDSCLTLNTNGWNFFGDGVHAVFGYSSISYQGQKKRWSWSCFCYKTIDCSEEIYDAFFRYWISQKNEMLNAYTRSVRDELYEDFPIPGVQAGAWSLHGYLDDGSFFDGACEKIDNVYNAPAPNNLSLWYSGLIMGNPIYETPE